MKKRAAGSRSPLAVTVIPAGCGGPPGAALRLAAGRADEQPGIVAADGPGADQDGVGRGPLGVHPVQIGRAGQHQPVPPVPSRQPSSEMAQLSTT